MARSKKSITPPMRKKPPVRDAHQPSVHPSCGVAFVSAGELTSGAEDYPNFCPQVSSESFRAAAAAATVVQKLACYPGANVLWVSDSHIDILAVLFGQGNGKERRVRTLTPG